MTTQFPRRFDDSEERDTKAAPPGVVDAHVHIFPPRVFAAIRRWFDEHAWEIRYPFDAEAVDGFMGDRGIDYYLGLHYAHRPDMARELNRFALAFSRAHPRCVPCATVLPGEPDAEAILDEALGAGAVAVKIHSHVQCVAPNDPRMDAIYRQVLAHDALLVIHCGDAPATGGYVCDVEALCSVEAFDEAMRRYPELKVSVPHFGASRVRAFEALLDRYPNLYLDTAMGLAGYFEFEEGIDLVRRRWSRILYGTDFPHLPYAWDRDLRALEEAGLSDEQLAAILGDTARKLLKLPERAP